MIFKQRLTWFFLAYLVLFLNLGSSIHRADFFGIHHSFHSPDSVVPVVPFGCGCCHHHPADGVNGLESDVRCFSDHDCSICEFFAKFNVIFDDFRFGIESKSVSEYTSLEDSIAERISVSPFPRGPPTC